MVAPLHIGLDGISFSYPGGHRVLTDIAFAVPSGSVTGLIGENLSLIHISEPTRRS